MASVLGALITPLVGITIGVTALVGQFLENAKKRDAVNTYFDELKAAYKKGGYDWNKDRTALVPQSGVVIAALDLEKNEVEFGDNNMQQMEAPGKHTSPSSYFFMWEGKVCEKRLKTEVRKRLTFTRPFWNATRCEQL